MPSLTFFGFDLHPLQTADVLLAEMVSGATETTKKTTLPDTISVRVFREHVSSIKMATVSTPLTAQVDFVQKMFVFLELDNLEFAYDKHQADLLDNSQMLRACQIFQSRCLDMRFRRLALLLGQDNYDPRFVRLTQVLAVFGHVRSGPADT